MTHGSSPTLQLVIACCFCGYPCCIGDSLCLRFWFSFILCMRLAVVILLLWFIVCSFLTVAFVTVAFLTVACFVLLMNWSFIAVSYCCEGQVWVKTLFLHETWSRSGEWWSRTGSDASRCVRNVSRIRESMSTGYRFASEDFQNIETLIVVRSSVFVLSSVHNTQLARDAHNALWNSRRPGQVRNYSLVRVGNWLFEDSRMCQIFLTGIYLTGRFFKQGGFL